MKDYNALFESVGFVYEYRTESESFFRPFFKSEEELFDFFYSVFKNDTKSNKPRQMMNQIQRFVSLANDIEKIRPGRDPLRVLFLRICLESLCKLSESKSQPFYDSFSNCFTDIGRKYILTHFVFSEIAKPDGLSDIESASFNSHRDYNLTCADFLKTIYATRNNVVHDGNYWSTQFFARDNDSTWLTTLTTDNEILSCQPKGQMLTYCFNTTMQYEVFISFFVEACIRFVIHFSEMLDEPQN